MSVSRLLVSMVLAALLIPGAVHAQSRRSNPAGTRSTAAGAMPVRIGAYIGFESGDWDGLALRFDGEVPIQRLAPNLMLSGVGSVGFSHLTLSSSGFDSTVNRFDIIPAARLTLDATPQFSLYGDAGLGLYYARLNVDSPFGSGNTSDFSVKMRFGVGGFFAVNPQLDLGGELALQPHFGDYGDTTFTIMVAGRFRMQ
jgi:outer membrane protein with beta-barrel domain